MFLLLGDGTEKAKLETKVKEYNLDNVQFGDFIAPQEYAALLKEVDAGLMSLEKNCKTPTIPGKFFGFAAASRPVLAFLNCESEGHRVIKEAQCGYSMVPDDPHTGALLVRKMYNEKGPRLDQLGANGYTYVGTHFSKEACIDKFEKIFTHV